MPKSFGSITEKIVFTTEYRCRKALSRAFVSSRLRGQRDVSLFDNIGLVPIFYIFYDYLLRCSGRATSLVQLWDELALVVFFIHMAFDLDEDSSPKGWKIAFVMFFLSGLAGLAASGYMGRSTIDGYRLIFQPVLWAAYFIHIFRKKGTRAKAMDVMAAIGTFISVHAVLQIIFEVPMKGNWVDTTDVISLRAFSILGSPNSLGSILIMHIGFLTGLAWAEKNGKKRLLYIACEAVALAALYFTYSRGAILALAGATLVLLMMNSRRLLLYLSFLGAGLILLIDKGAYRFYNLVSPDTISNMMADGRLSKWAFAFGEFLKNPVFGRGYGQFGGSIAIKYGITNFYTDNFYLKTLVENGIFGLAAFLLFAGYFIWQIARQGGNRVQMGISIGLIAFLLHNFVDNLYGIPVITFYYYIYFALGISILNDKAREVI